MVTRVPIRAAIVASVTAAVAASLVAAPALAASAGSSQPLAAAASLPPAKLPLSAARMQADQRLHSQAQGPTGALTGLARSAVGSPLIGVCVTAYGSSGEKSAVTNESGRFLLTGLRSGRYQLQFRSCDGSSSQYLPEWYGDSTQRGGSRTVVVTGSQLEPVQPLAPVTLYPANSTLGDLPRAIIPQHSSDQVASNPFGRLAADPTSASALIQSLMASGAGHASQAVTASGKSGRIAGIVTSRAGRGLKGICVVAFSESTFAIGTATTGKTGAYHTTSLPAGKYQLIFFAQCGNTGNWLTQIYKGIYNLAKAPTLVRIKAGHTTGSVNVAMKAGGEISGTVTGPQGKKLYGICVSPLTNSSAGDLVFGAVSRDGVYHVRGVPAGAYQLGFAPCLNADYAPTLWPGTQNANAAATIRVKGPQIISNIDEVMQLGGMIKGTVTAATTAATPLAGICVYVQENDGLGESGSAATDGSGHYTIKGLASGSYSVQFQPGCNNNGNYVGTSYPTNVNVTSGATKSGIDGSLPPGATISGTVTSAKTGQPVSGICVEVDSSDFGAAGLAVSAADGTYSVDQLPVDTYQVVFSGGCGNAGSFAPQAYDNTNVLEPQNINVTTAGQTVADISAALQPGPVIAGTVTDSSGHKLSGICVFAVTPGGAEFGQGVTANGKYAVPDLAPGLYQVSFAPGCGSNADLAAQSFRSPANGSTAATVSANSGTISGINATLAPAGGISGAIRAKTGRALQFSCIILTGLTGNARSLVDEELIVGSTYQLTGLPLGGYQVAFAPACAGSGLETQWYKNKPSPHGASTVVVRAHHITGHIDSALIPGGSIAGRITSAGNPVHDMCVYAQNVAQLADFGASISNRNGYYDVHGLNSGEYELFLSPCGTAANALASELVPQLVHVSAPKRTSGVTTDVPVAGRISGSVGSGSPASALAGVCVEAFESDGLASNLANTGLDGTFSMTNLPPGQYLVEFGDPACSESAPNLAPQWYQHQPIAQTATLVSVTSGASSALAAATLTTDGTIGGTVTGLGGTPLRGVCVAAVATGIGTVPVYSVTSKKGTYTIFDLAPGQYRVQFSSGCGAVGYKTQWWNDKPTRSAATIITVSTGTATTGIGAALRK